MLMEFDGQTFTADNFTEFKNLNMSEFDDCTFSGIDFLGVSFRSWRFSDCQFIKCSFSEVDVVNTTFREVTFKDCRLMGINWASTKNFSDPRFESCKLDYSVFQGADLRKVSFLDCSAKDVDFTNCNLSGAVFTGTSLQNASFNQSDLRNADLRGASRYFIDPQYTKLKGAKVDFPEASSILSALGLKVNFH